MKLNLGYPGLCLCLLFSILMVACAVKRTQDVKTGPVVDSNNPVYQLQVKLIMHNNTEGLQSEFIPYLVHSFNNRYWDNSLLFGPQEIVLYFRFPDMKQLQQCRDQLLTTGQVEQISITKY